MAAAGGSGSGGGGSSGGKAGGKPVRRKKSSTSKSSSSKSSSAKSSSAKSSSKKASPPKKKRSTAKPSSKSRPARKRSSGRGKGRRGKGGLAGLARDVGRWVGLRLGLVLLGGLLGLAAVTGILYRQALADVDDLLARPVWSRTGRVMSGPIELWPGLSLTPEQLALDLQRAGYARVGSVGQPGDFSVAADAVRIQAPVAEGPGYKVAAGEHLVSFRDGRVALAGGKERLQLAPAELAQVRGPDNESRRPVTLAEIPPHVVDAVLAMEDSRFREHEGLDPLGIARALLVNAAAGSTVQGGSTLTQQTVKNLFLTSERSYERKAKEALLAIALEQRRSKDEILELYLNEIYLGQVAGAAVCGVDQAARAYFGKPVDRLDLGEAATIAGIISAPNRYSPLKHPEAALERRNIVLARMSELGLVTAEAAAQEQERPLQVHALGGGRGAPWAVDAALEAVEAELGEGSVAARGLTVYTTIQPALQRLAEEAVAAGAAELDEAWPKAAGAEIALVAVRVSDGAIVAMVGGRDYGSSQFNRAMDGRRQVGSTVKPLTWLFAFDADPSLSPGTVVDDEPLSRVVDGKTWEPQNYDNAFVGPISLREALVHSRNVPAVLIAEELGFASLKRHLLAAGLTTATDWPSASLGSFGATPVELAGAYTAFPQAGLVSQPRLLQGAADAGSTVIEATPPQRQRVADATAAWLATDILQQVISRGTGASASRYGVGRGAGGKTGTTDDARDAWFAGFTGDLAVVVWVGFDRQRDLGLTGARAALPTWARFVAATGTTRASLPGQPAGLTRVEVCIETGEPPCTGMFSTTCEERVEDWWRSGEEPEADCGVDLRLNLIERLRGRQAQGTDDNSVEGETRAERRKRRREERRGGG